MLVSATLGVLLAGCGSHVTQSATTPIKPRVSSECISPTAVSLVPGARQSFVMSVCGLAAPSAQWAVNGINGGSLALGTVSAGGVYVAPAINPGAPVTISATNTGTGISIGSATVTITNLPLAPFEGATYAQTLAGWNASQLKWIENLSGLTWDPAGRNWMSTHGWQAPSEGIAPNIYYLEEALRPATRMAITHQDIQLIEELAMFHVALLQTRTITIGNLLATAPANSILFIDGPADARTFAWYEPISSTQVRIRDCQTCNAQYLSTASRLLRAIAELPSSLRTASMLVFAQQYSSFLISDQLIRLLYGSTTWSHWNNPNISQPVVSAWEFLARTGYEPPDPIKYQAAMTDIELWLVMSSAEVVAANSAAPELALLTSTELAQLQRAVTSGVSLIQARCHHGTADDGADILSAFAGDYDDHPDYAYSGITSTDQPTAPAPRRGLSWDISHAYRLPVIFRSLYETRAATGVTYPNLVDLIALANSYVHQAYNGNSSEPAFNNYLDGWNGWFGVSQPSIPNGYPPYQTCSSQQDPDNCLTAGTVQGWGELASFNPELASLSQTLITLAYDDSDATAAFKTQHYFYAGQHYNVSSGTYPMLMVYVAADSAERLQ